MKILIVDDHAIVRDGLAAPAGGRRRSRGQAWPPPAARRWPWRAASAPTLIDPRPQPARPRRPGAAAAAGARRGRPHPGALDARRAALRPPLAGSRRPRLRQQERRAGRAAHRRAPRRRRRPLRRGRDRPGAGAGRRRRERWMRSARANWRSCACWPPAPAWPRSPRRSAPRLQDHRQHLHADQIQARRRPHRRPGAAGDRDGGVVRAS